MKLIRSDCERKERGGERTPIEHIARNTLEHIESVGNWVVHRITTITLRDGRVGQGACGG